MLKRLLFVGLGIAIIAAKKSASYLAEIREKETAEAATGVSNAEDPVEILSQEEETAEGTEEIAPAEVSSEVDDLTKISGIGPTYAKRLHEAGINTFEALSKQSAEDLRSITQARGQTAELDSWIKQADDLTQ